MRSTLIRDQAAFDACCYRDGNDVWVDYEPGDVEPGCSFCDNEIVGFPFFVLGFPAQSARIFLHPACARQLEAVLAGLRLGLGEG